MPPLRSKVSTLLSLPHRPIADLFICLPVQPEMHSHVKSPSPSRQIPPFRQGFGEHSFRSASSKKSKQDKNVSCAAQTHKKKTRKRICKQRDKQGHEMEPRSFKIKQWKKAKCSKKVKVAVLLQNIHAGELIGFVAAIQC